MEDPSTVTVLVMLSVFSIFGTIGNSLVLYIYSCKKEKSTAGIFIMSLAGTDLVTCLLIVPFTEVVIFLEYRLEYDAACKIYMFLITCNVPFSAFIMVAIALDRYFCICHPFLHALNLVRSKRIVICLLLLASVFGVITALIHGVYVIGEIPIDTPILNNTQHLGDVIAHGTDLNQTGISANVTQFVNQSSSSCDPITNASCVTSSSPDIPQTKLALVHYGICVPNYIIIGQQFGELYQKIYAGFYLLSFTAVVILYGLIYRSIHDHRAKRSKRKRSSLYPSAEVRSQSVVEFSMIETAVTHVNPHGKKNSNGRNGSEQSEDMKPMQPKPRKTSKALSIKEKTLLANIRTAAMLFVVTIVFLVAFLPAWLMAHGLVKYNQVIFYMYFVYNTANPFIYAFMNRSFRDDLGKVIKCQSVPLVR